MAILTEEQTMLRDSAKGWVADKAPVAALRTLRDSGTWKTGYDAASFAQMAEMGWTGVIIPEAFGGSELGVRAMGLVLEETGRTLAASPLHASALVGASALMLGGSDAQKTHWLPKIAAGEAVAALAVDEGAHHKPASVAMTATATSSARSCRSSPRSRPTRRSCCRSTTASTVARSPRSRPR